jgi:hypothetical protein
MFRAQGLRIAMDDAGVGYFTSWHITATLLDTVTKLSFSAQLADSRASPEATLLSAIDCRADVYDIRLTDGCGSRAEVTNGPRTATSGPSVVDGD